MRSSELALGTRAVADRLHEVTRRVPDRVAVTDLEHHLTFRALETAVVGTALRLIDPGLPRGPVLLAANDGIAFAIGLLGAAAAGRAAVPTGGKGSTSGLWELALRSGASVIIGERSHEHLGTGLPVIEPERGEPIGSRRTGLAAILDGTLDGPIEWSDVVALTGTSGSTGDPKLLERLCGISWGRTLPPIDQLAVDHNVATNFSMTGAFANRMTHAILAGSTFTSIPLDRYPPSGLLRMITAGRVTTISTTPSVLRRLWRAASSETRLVTVRHAETVGEPLRWSDVAMARELCGPGLTVVNRFGSSEAGIVSMKTVDPDEPIQDGALSVGRPLDGRGVWIADEAGRPALLGHTGRIVIDGLFTTRGIPLETLPDGTSRFRSADLGRIDAEGELWFEGRADRMVKVAGTRVEPGAVEAALRDVPGVIDVAVLPVPIGQDEWRLVAHVAVAQGGPDAAELRRIAGERVTAVAVPVRFHLRAEPLPLLPSGKIDVQLLMSSHSV